MSCQAFFFFFCGWHIFIILNKARWHITHCTQFEHGNIRHLSKLVNCPAQSVLFIHNTFYMEWNEKYVPCASIMSGIFGGWFALSICLEWINGHIVMMLSLSPYQWLDKFRNRMRVVTMWIFSKLLGKLTALTHEAHDDNIFHWNLSFSLSGCVCGLSPMFLVCWLHFTMRM